MKETEYIFGLIADAHHIDTDSPHHKRFMEEARRRTGDLERRVEKLQEVLAPFARYVEHHGCTNLVGTHGEFLTADHWLAAHKALEKKQA